MENTKDQLVFHMPKQLIDEEMRKQIAPFRPEDILYLFKVENVRKRPRFVADVYALVRNANTTFGFSIWGKFDDLWENSYEGERFIISHFLSEREGWIDTARRFGLERDNAEASLERVERERDVYKQALEKYAVGTVTGPEARVALETGKKLRGEV